MAPVEISVAEILDALRSAHGVDPRPTDAFTLKEIRAATGWGTVKVAGHLTALKERGLLEVVRVTREALDGRASAVPAYRFKKGKKK